MPSNSRRKLPRAHRGRRCSQHQGTANVCAWSSLSLCSLSGGAWHVPPAICMSLHGHTAAMVLYHIISTSSLRVWGSRTRDPRQPSTVVSRFIASSVCFIAALTVFIGLELSSCLDCFLTGRPNWSPAPLRRLKYWHVDWYVPSVQFGGALLIFRAVDFSAWTITNALYNQLGLASAAKGKPYLDLVRRALRLRAVCSNCSIHFHFLPLLQCGIQSFTCWIYS